VTALLLGVGLFGADFAIEAGAVAERLSRIKKQMSLRALSPAVIFAT
jgi:hypothetical protein